MTYEFKSANVYYGLSVYPMHLIEGNPEFAKLDGLPEEESIISAIARCIGALGYDEVKARIRHFKIVPEVSMPEHDIYMPETIQIIGNGFSVIWDKI